MTPRVNTSTLGTATSVMNEGCLQAAGRSQPTTGEHPASAPKSSRRALADALKHAPVCTRVVTGCPHPNAVFATAIISPCRGPVRGMKFGSAMEVLLAENRHLSGRTPLQTNRHMVCSNVFTGLSTNECATSCAVGLFQPRRFKARFAKKKGGSWPPGSGVK